MKVAVIGGGVAGLAAAVALSGEGRAVTVYEANDKVGGCCAGTVIDGFRFNDGAMFVALPRLLDHAFAALGLDREASLPLSRIAVPHAAEFPDGMRIVLGASGPDGDVEKLVARWRPVLARLVDDVLPCPLSMARVLRATWRFLPQLRGTVGDELGRTIRDARERAALASALEYTGVPVARLPVTQIAGLIAMLDDGLYLPDGGLGAIPQTLERALRGAGAEILTDARVERIELVRGRVAGIHVAGRGVVPCDAVVSTVSGMLTLGLLGSGSAPPSMRKRVARAPLSQTALSVQLGTAVPIDAPAYTTSMIDGGLTFTARGQVIEMYPEFDPAQAVGVAAERAIARLREHHPCEIIAQRVRGPVDFERDLNLYRGAVYGLSPAAPPYALFPRVTPVPGLYQAGQTSWPGFGVATSMLSGIFAAKALGNSHDT